MLIECLSTWNLWKQFHDIYLILFIYNHLFIITSACVAEMPLENFDGFSVEQFASEEREEKLVSCKSYTDLYCS